MNRSVRAIFISFFVFVILVASTPCTAAVYKCRDEGGAPVYKDKPCKSKSIEADKKNPYEGALIINEEERNELAWLRFEKEIEDKIKKWEENVKNYTRYEAKMPDLVSKAIVETIASRYKSCKRSAKRRVYKILTINELYQAEAHYLKAIDILDSSEVEKSKNKKSRVDSFHEMISREYEPVYAEVFSKESLGKRHDEEVSDKTMKGIKTEIREGDLLIKRCTSEPFSSRAEYGFSSFDYYMVMSYNSQQDLTGARTLIAGEWPLTVEDGNLACRSKPYGKKEVVLETDKGMLAINGSARGNKQYKDGVDYLLPGKIPADLYPLITNGLNLCN